MWKSWFVTMANVTIHEYGAFITCTRHPELPMDQRTPRRKLLAHALRFDFSSLAQSGVALVVACTVAYLIQR